MSETRINFYKDLLNFPSDLLNLIFRVDWIQFISLASAPENEGVDLAFADPAIKLRVLDDRIHIHGRLVPLATAKHVRFVAHEPLVNKFAERTNRLEYVFLFKVSLTENLRPDAIRFAVRQTHV